MTSRRDFLKSLAIAAVAQKLPIGLVDGAPQILAAAAPVAVEVFAPYGLAFYITQEMLEDCYYGDELEVLEWEPVHNMALVQFKDGA